MTNEAETGKLYEEGCRKYSTWTVEKLKDELERLRALREEIADTMAFAASKFGQNMLDDKRRKLDKVLETYGRDLKAHLADSAEIIVRMMQANLVNETVLRADIADIEGKEKVSKSLDAALASCRTVLRKQEELAKKAR